MAGKYHKFAVSAHPSTSALWVNSWGQKVVIFFGNSLTRAVFEVEKCFFFFKWVRISPEIDWYHYQGASPAPTCIVRHQTMTKTSTR